ncbi:MAG: hypothetical protein AAF548_15450 [Actinomycetota bacterium]
MTATNDNGLADLANWKLFVARATNQIRDEIGENAANQLSSMLVDAQDGAIAAARDDLENTLDGLATAQAETAAAQRAHERLQLDLTRMEAALRDAKADAARVRADADAFAAKRRAEIDALAQSEAEAAAAERENLRALEAEFATRRAEVVDIEASVAQRHAEIDRAEEELQTFRATIETERDEAGRLLDEALADLDRREADLAAQGEALEARRAEIEADLAARIDEFERRQPVIDLTELEAAGDESPASSLWGRGRRLS